MSEEERVLFSIGLVSCALSFIISLHEFHETSQTVTSHRAGQFTPKMNRICFHPWCELTLAFWCHSIVWSLFHETKCNGMTIFMEFMIIAKATCHYAIFNAPHAAWSVTTGHNFIHSFYSLKFQSSFLTKKKKRFS